MMRSIRLEVTSVLAIFALPAALLIAFPYDKLDVRGADELRRSVCRASLVVLTAEEEHAAMQAARSAWQVSRERQNRLQANLFVAELPATVNPSVLDVSSRPTAPRPQPIGYDFPPMLPSYAAEPQRKIEPSVRSAGEMQTFSREELLKLN